MANPKDALGDIKDALEKRPQMGLEPLCSIRHFCLHPWIVLGLMDVPQVF